MSYKYIDLKIENYVATVAMARVDALNALSLEFASEIASVFRELGANDDVRAIIFCSKARIFCAGLDLKEAAAGASNQAKVVLDVIRQSQPLFDCCNFIEECPKPVIAAVHGKCIGGGLDMISACDIRLATKDAVFSVRETRLGIVADGGTIQRLPRLIGHGRAAELALTGRDFTAGEALAMGFVTRLCEDREALLAEARRLAGEIANLPPLTVQGVKDTLIQARDNGVYPGLEYVAQKNAALIPNQDMLEAVAAFLEKRQPIFKGR